MNTQKKFAVILWDDYWHPADTIAPLLPLIFDEKQWNLRITDDANYIGALEIAPDIVMNFKDGIANTSIPTANWYQTGAWHHWTYEDVFKEGGAGYIGVHCGLANIPGDSLAYTELLHGRFLSHPPKCRVKVIVDQQHPVTDGVTDFDIEDEHYQMEGLWDDTNVLCHTQSEHGSQVGVWTSEYGNTRAVGITPGHTTDVLTHPNMVRLLRNAINWASKRV